MNDTQTPLRETIAAWLRDEGHEAEVEVTQDPHHGNVYFRARDFRFTVFVDERDPDFLFMALWTDLPDEVTEELAARRAVALTELRCKVVKVDLLWDERSLAFRAEQLVAEPGGPSIFWRTVALLETSVDRMREAVDEVVGHAAASRFTEQLEAELANKPGPHLAPPSSMEDAR